MHELHEQFFYPIREFFSASEGFFILSLRDINLTLRGGRAWGGDLIVFVGPGVGHLTDLVLPGEGIFESFFARRGDI